MNTTFDLNQILMYKHYPVRLHAGGDLIQITYGGLKERFPFVTFEEIENPIHIEGFAMVFVNMQELTVKILANKISDSLILKVVEDVSLKRRFEDYHLPLIQSV